MKMTPTSLPEVVLIEPRLFEDERGWFMESFNEHRFREGLKELGLQSPPSFVQDNHSFSRQGVLRGLHYQLPPHAQGKLVRVVQGEVFDVAVDIRKDSPTFGEWVGVTLSAENKRQLWIPPGFAHGFLTLSKTAEFLYKTTDFYAKECEAGIRWNDPELGIEWPMQEKVLLAPKDAAAPTLSESVAEGKIFSATKGNT